MNKRIIAMAGPQRAGKSTVVSEILNRVKNASEWVVINTSEIVIQGVAGKSGLSAHTIRTNKDRYRQVLQEFSELHPGYVCHEIAKLVEMYPDRDILIDSTRRKEECQLVDGFNGLFLLVSAREDVRRARAGGKLEGADHPTEVEGSEYLLDHKNCYLVENSHDRQALTDRVGQVLFQEGLI